MGRRDRALLLFLCNTGTRINEALAIRPRDLQFCRPFQVQLLGKGRKERICPLWSETVTALRSIPINIDSDERVFLSTRGTALTRDGAAYILATHVRRASETSPALRGRRVTPHILRHSCAVALAQAGVDINVIRDPLGHASIATTSRYRHTNLKMKREVLQAFWKPPGWTDGPPHAGDHLRNFWRSSIPSEGCNYPESQSTYAFPNATQPSVWHCLSG